MLWESVLCSWFFILSACFNSEQIQAERTQALEKMGIFIQKSGIKVDHEAYYLVNLSRDPSFNEMLVYYLKVRNWLSAVWQYVPLLEILVFDLCRKTHQLEEQMLSHLQTFNWVDWGFRHIIVLSLLKAVNYGWIPVMVPLAMLMVVLWSREPLYDMASGSHLAIIITLKLTVQGYLAVRSLFLAFIHFFTSWFDSIYCIVMQKMRRPLGLRQKILILQNKNERCRNLILILCKLSWLNWRKGMQ